MTTRQNSPYVPSFLRSARSDSRPVQLTFADADMSNTNFGDPGSFKYDPLDFPLKSTQQIILDWSKFENHTFFSSAEVKVNEAFNVIVNNFPFDGTKKEVEAFLEGLTGFERWVFDSFPQWSGALHFSGSWISVTDKSGFLFPELSKNSEGKSVINPPATSSLSIEAQVFLPTQANGIQTIFQKASSTSAGFSLFLEATSSTSAARAIFCVSSGSLRSQTEAWVPKGQYSQICTILERLDSGTDSLQLFVNSVLAATSSKTMSFGHLDADDAPLVIGSGSSFLAESGLITPTQTLSGTIDEFRVFHNVRDLSKQKVQGTKGLYAQPDLRLYYRFNEPPPPLTLGSPTDPVNAVVLDSSGNSLHATIQNFTGSLRVNAALDALNPVINERPEFKTVLFPANNSVLSLNSVLLASASVYDRSNPNLITRLIPPHYLLEGADQDGFENPEGTIGDPYGGSGIPGQGEMGSAQIILSFLYIWAKFFDETKIYLDSFSTLKSVDYHLTGSVPDNFLVSMMRDTGFYLPPFFNHSTTAQYSEGEEITSDDSVENPLKKIQALLLRRVLVNMPDIIRSKGTQHSIRSFLRSVGIDPDNSVRIREYGGPTVKALASSRDKKMEPSTMVDFQESSLVVTPYLVAQRTEPGWPYPSATPIYGSLPGSENSDWFLTSGSWTFESLVKFPPQKVVGGTQSLLRLEVTGAAATSPMVITNIIATQKTRTDPARIKAYIHPGVYPWDPMLTLSMDLRGDGMFDGEKWNVSLACARNDEIGTDVSSSYTLRAGKSSWGDIEEAYQTSSYFYEVSDAAFPYNAFRYPFVDFNDLGVFAAVGTNQIIDSGVGEPYLGDTLTVPSEARTTQFDGWSSNLRFWTKSTTETEWKERVRNYRSLGVSDSKLNYNFVTNLTGSFERLRMDTLAKQDNNYSDPAGNITLLDFSLNNMHAMGTGFLTGTRVTAADIFSYGFLSPHFDEAATDDKIRIRSLDDSTLRAENPWATGTPSWAYRSLFIQEEPQDDVRLSIEFSLVDALDRDIVNMFSTFDELGDALGDPSLMFATDYPALEVMRDVYFNRLSEKMNFRSFLDFYRWFDASISTFVEQLLPSKTKYKGTNFVVESHILERHKNSYNHSENYMGDKRVINDALLVQQLTTVVKKY